MAFCTMDDIQRDKRTFAINKLGDMRFQLQFIEIYKKKPMIYHSILLWGEATVRWLIVEVECEQANTRDSESHFFVSANYESSRLSVNLKFKIY